MTKREGDRAAMSTELSTAGRCRLVASEQAGRPWTTLAPGSWPVLHRYRFTLPDAICANKVPRPTARGGGV